MRRKTLYRKETNFKVYEISPGYGKYKGKFVAECRGWGGGRSWLEAFDSLDEAIEFIEKRSAPTHGALKL